MTNKGAAMTFGRALKAWIRFELTAAIVLAGVVLAAAGLPAKAQSGADLIDRIQRLEAQIRSMNGMLEQSQFRIRQLEDQQRRTQADLEFRLNELESQRGGAARPGQARPAQPGGAPAQQQPGRRSDAFDPSAQPAAPGQPRDLGGIPGANAAPPRVAGGAQPGGAGGAAQPLDLGQLSGQVAADPSLEPRGPAGGGAQPPTLGPSGTQPIIASSPRQEYDQATAMVNRREYEQAEIALRGFLAAHPRDRLVGDATHQLGETMYLRRQYREAAEQFLKVSTDYPRSARAPSSLLRLGQSLNALGEREAACAAYAEFNRKFPNAGQQTKQAVANEQRRASC
ncbi:tol-pal system protein YbgF [Phreatobacter aquaticus]|uniref:Cell division coordinator CpoB n=1 Tax=Phreatobacter aquaticus TaxID=2570229 RepID=A0A4D7QR22_9HYPH|nr:tol-pal system protein YbgF [Phreatobacter aquaticus]QCK88443.1 tol-pal system protein YbgF [Phreatobacter aquaticus]